MRLRATRLSAVAHAANRLLGAAPAWSPLSWFAASEQGAWYDPTDLTRYMDVSSSPELVTNGDFSSAVGWSFVGGVSISIAGGVCTWAATSINNERVVRSIGHSANTRYRVSITVSGYSAGGVKVVLGNGAIYESPIVSANGTYVYTVLSNGDAFDIRATASGTALSVDNISVREIPLIAQATMYQDAAGTTPVTAVEQPVGLILDRRLGALGALGADLLAGAGSFVSSSGWTAQTGWSISGGGAAATSSSSLLFYPGGIVPGRQYLVTFDVVSISAGTIGVSFNPDAFTPTFNTVGTKSVLLRAGASANGNVSLVGASFTGSIDNFTVREVPGNHASQATSTARPTLRNRYNLLTFTEQFDNVAWGKLNATVTANSTTDPSGALTADTIVENTASAGHGLQVLGVFTGISNRTLRLCVKAAGRNRVALGFSSSGGIVNNVFAVFDVSAGSVLTPPAPENGSCSIAPLTNGWYLISVSSILSSTVPDRFVLNFMRDTDATPTSYVGDGVSGVSVAFAEALQLVDASLPYQRVTTATDYDSDPAKFPLYLAFDGSDDSMVTGSIDFSATDEMTVVAGVSNLTAASLGMLFELTATANANAGAFNAYVNDAGTGGVVARSNKQGSPTGPSEVAVSAPNKQVYGFDYDLKRTIGGQAIYIKRNGTAYSNGGTNPAGSEKFANAALFIGRRGGSSLPFNGRLHQLIIRGKTSADIAQAESFVAARTGVTL